MVSYFHLIQLHWAGCYRWSTMPPWYALPVLHVGFSSICWHLFWSNWGHKFHSRYPQSITLHPARLTPQPRISIASTGRKYQNLMVYDCMRDSSKRWKNQDFPHIPYYHIPEDFTCEGGNKKKLFRCIFLPIWLFALCEGFLVYDPLCGARWSVSMCVECDGVLWSARTPLERDATWVCAAGNPLREGFWATILQIQQSGCLLFNRISAHSTNKLNNILKPSAAFFSLQNGKLTYQGTL